MDWNAKWIAPKSDFGDICPQFTHRFTCGGRLKKAVLRITALGVYEARIGGKRVGSFVLAPGWTTYSKRLQVQTYEVTDLIGTDNEITVTVGKGWYRSPMPGFSASEVQQQYESQPAGLTAELIFTYADGCTQRIRTNEDWRVRKSHIRFSEIYGGETCDARDEILGEPEDVTVFAGPTETLIEQQGEEIRETGILTPARIFTTPKGECVVDFGQNMTGYVSLTLSAYAGEEILLSHAEVLDKEGNFYTDNYRSAKAKLHYICKDGMQSYKPVHTFFGFRYIRIDKFPESAGAVTPEVFRAVVVHSDMKRTGTLRSANPMLNKLFENVIWGQRGNFVDVPTDCPQRDERLGWTGDAQVFIRTACLNYDAEVFFTKWLADMSADQHADGYVGHVIPDILGSAHASAAWGDAAVICPWELYLAYGNTALLRSQYSLMKGWVSYITTHTKDKNLWTGGEHYGDWLGLDAPIGSYKGSSREDFIASAFYAHAADLTAKAGRALGEDVTEYETLHSTIVSAFKDTYPTCKTQTECVLVLYFHLTSDEAAAAAQLADLIKAAGTQLTTGFVGTPYLLHVLSAHGYTKLAYDLLLRTSYPSWLYPITKGATTIWEHWDGIMEDGGFWSKDMNSFNHYAYGCVTDWVYREALGIKSCEDAPGYRRIHFAPKPDARIGYLEAELDTRAGHVRSYWERQGDDFRFEITTPVAATVTIDGRTHTVEPGSYIFYAPVEK